MKRAWLVSAFLVAGCLDLSEEYAVDSLKPDAVFPPPSVQELDYWRKHEPWRSDPRRLAHEELQFVSGIPFSGQAYDPAIYTFHEGNPQKPEWGSYVVRGWTDRSGRVWRYRVMVSQDRGLWYARQIDHYFTGAIADDSHR